MPKKKARPRKQYQQHRINRTPVMLVKLQVHGTCLRNNRVGRDMTLADLAKKTGASIASLSNIEQARSWPSMPLYIKLCEVFGIKVPLL